MSGARGSSARWLALAKAPSRRRTCCPRDARLSRTVHRVVRHRVGYHAQLRRIAAASNTSLAVVAPGIAGRCSRRGGGAYPRRPSDRRLQQIHRRADAWPAACKRQSAAPAGCCPAPLGCERWPCHCRRSAVSQRTNTRTGISRRRDQRDADGRRDAGAADHLHGDRAAVGGRRAADLPKTTAAQHSAEGAGRPQPRSRRRHLHR